MKYFKQSRKYKIIQYSLLFILGIALAISFLLCKNPINVSAKSADTLTDEMVNLDNDPLSEFEGVNFIPNKYYFYLNPRHHSNIEGESSWGLCTTVAMQMLMGYHNYYTDRRLIPATTSDGKRFLSDNYASFAQNPVIMGSRDIGLGYLSLGTEDAFFDELCDLEILSESIGQMFPLVVSAAEQFIDKYSNTIKDNVTISFETFDYNVAKGEIDAGRPIMLGFRPGNGAKSHHVVIAYGYATYNENQGFIVHYGHSGDKTQIWVPSKYFGYQVTMTVRHNHSMEIADSNYIDACKILQCTQCGCEMLDSFYNVSNSGNEITGLKYTDEVDITIPAKINGNEIKTIAKSSFENTSIRNVTIADGVTEVGEKAFKNCKNLQSVTLPQELSQITKETFSGCNKLEKINFPNKLESIGTEAFLDCRSLQHVVIFTNTTKKIGDKAFMNCELLKIVEIYEGVLEIGSYAFYNTRLESLYIPDSVKTIKDYAFSECDQLTRINIPDSVTEVGTGLFMGASALKEVTLSKNLISIPDKTFYGCSNLETVVIPDGVQIIKDYAFSKCDLLTRINIPDSVTEIGTGLFIEASNLKEVTLSKNLISIPDKVFHRCNKLEKVVIPEKVVSIGMETFYECGALNDVSLPNSVTSIGVYAFAKCFNLKKIELPTELREIPDGLFWHSDIYEISIPYKTLRIGNSAFYGCEDLRLVTIPNKRTVVEATAFLNTGMISLVGIKDINYTLTQSGTDFTIYFDKSYETLPTLKVEVNGSSAEDVSMQKDRCTFKSKKIKINDYNYITCSFTQLGYAIIGSSIEIGIRESYGIYESAYRETVDQCQTADVCMLIPYETEYYFKIVYSLHNRLKELNMNLGTMCANSDANIQVEQLESSIEMGKTIIMVWEVEQGCLNDYMSTVDTSNTLILLFNSSNEESIADYYFLSNYYLAGYEQACHIIDSTDNESNEIELFVSNGAHGSDDYQVYYSGFVQALNDYSSELLINEHIVSDKDEVAIIAEELIALDKVPAAIVFFEEYLFDEQSCSKFDLSQTLIIAIAYSDETLYYVNEGIIETVWYFDPESVTEPVIQILEGGYVEEVYYIDFIVVNNANVFDYLNEGI